jgi:serine/threonine-protein kinase
VIGATIGNYRVVAKLGEGGMGAVYLAEHPLIGKKVALKVMREGNPDAAERFFNEARAVNAIGHPNIVDILDYGVVGKSVYLIMELLVGESLAALLAREGPLPVERALPIAVQIADALAACHQKGVIHRDLKPDNVFLLANDRVKLLDFGIAKLTSGARRETGKGMVIGTPAYMSPEQCEGRRDIDARADIYALGILTYEMVTGAVPFIGDGYGDVLNQHITRPPLPPSAVRRLIPGPVEAIVLQALEKRRENRFASMEELGAALRDPTGFSERRPRPAPPALPLPPPPREATPPAHPTTLTRSAAELQRGAPPPRVGVVVASALGVLGLLGGATAWWLHGNRPPPPVPTVHAAPPAPPPPVPAPVVIPVVLPRVNVVVTSEPPGADVLVDGESRGRTPLTLELPRAERDVALTVKLAGYKDKTRAVHLGRDAEIDIELERAGANIERAGSTKGRERPAKPLDADGVMTPNF